MSYCQACGYELTKDPDEKIPMKCFKCGYAESDQIEKMIEQADPFIKKLIRDQLNVIAKLNAEKKVLVKCISDVAILNFKSKNLCDDALNALKLKRILS